MGKPSTLNFLTKNCSRIEELWVFVASLTHATSLPQSHFGR